jgi:Holliday junction resolvase RusA-like endonuclease
LSIRLTTALPQYQASVEKTFKQKQLNETYVAKAKERYEQDCHRVNSYTAQQSLVQGRDLEKVTMKLERAHSTVETNKRDYQNFTRALADTVTRWDSEWKAFCDQCQDLEEDRLEFMKDNVWAYANAVSTVCVNEDEVRLVVFPLINLLTGHI